MLPIIMAVGFSSLFVDHIKLNVITIVMISMFISIVG